jgi:ribosome biogenesis protein ENP2
VSINPTLGINDLLVYKESGVVFLGSEGSPVQSYYIPDLGPAPSWARFLDNMTEEMEDNQAPAVYEDYKFVDRKELKRWVHRRAASDSEL